MPEPYTKKMILTLIAEAGGEIPDKADKMKVGQLMARLANNAEDLGYLHGNRGAKANPFDPKKMEGAFQKYEDGFATAAAEVADAGKEPPPEPEMSVEDIKRKDPSKVTTAEREFMKSKGLVFTSSGWGAELSLPASSGQKREKRAPKNSVAPIVTAGLKAGHTDEQILADIAKALPTAKTTAGCIAWYASKLRGKGVQLPNRPRNVVVKAPATTPPTEESK